MHLRSGLVALAILSALSPTPSFAGVCMSTSMTMDEIVGVIGAAKSCERAMKIFQDCQMSTSGDIHLGEAVEKKCEADFMARLPPAKKAAYQREMGVCDRKYANEQGTMYRSFTAFCRAEIARRYSQRALKR